MLASQAMDFNGGAIKGFAEGYLGINVSGPGNSDEYYGQLFGRNTAGALAAWLAAKGGADTIIGSGTMGTSLAVEATTVGLATPVAGPTFLEGAALTLKGVIETGVGSIGLVNYSKLDPLEQPSSNGGSSESSGHSSQTGNSGASSSTSGQQLNSQLTSEEIAGGHSFEKHVVQGGELPGITSRSQFASHFENIINNPSEVKTLSNGRVAYWDNASQTVVIRNPKAIDGGTAFKPKLGKVYFDTQLK